MNYPINIPEDMTGSSFVFAESIPVFESFDARKMLGYAKVTLKGEKLVAEFVDVPAGAIFEMGGKIISQQNGEILTFQILTLGLCSNIQPERVTIPSIAKTQIN